MSRDFLKHPNLHDRGKQLTGKRFGASKKRFNYFDSVKTIFTFFQQQTGGLQVMLKKKYAALATNFAAGN